MLNIFKIIGFCFLLLNSSLAFADSHLPNSQFNVGDFVCEINCVEGDIPSEWTWSMGGSGRPSAWHDGEHVIPSGRLGDAWMWLEWRVKGANWENPWGRLIRASDNVGEVIWPDPYNLRIIVKPRVEGRDFVVLYEIEALEDHPKKEDGSPWLRTNSISIKFHPDISRDDWWLEHDLKTGNLEAIRWPLGFDIEISPPLHLETYYDLVLCEDRGLPPDCRPATAGIYHTPQVILRAGSREYSKGDRWSIELRFLHNDGIPFWHW